MSYFSDCTTKHNGMSHESFSDASYGVNDKSNFNAVMHIVHVIINNTVKIHCLLDTGSTSLFYSKECS